MTITIEQDLEILTCCACAMVFAVPGTFERQRRRDHACFWCPAGHGQSFSAESDEEKLRRERDRLKQKVAELADDVAAEKTRADTALANWIEADGRARAERSRANGYKGHATRITKRAKAGVCPCCNRTFQALARHMKTQHPQFTPIDVDQVPPDQAQERNAA